MNSLLKPLQAALRRLESSDTPRKRKNARKAFSRAVRSLQEHIDIAYRPLREDGSTIERSAPAKGYACPYCRVPLRSGLTLVKHLHDKHDWKRMRCPCGFHARVKANGVADINSLVRHLAAQRDLATHVAGATLAQAAQGLGVTP